MKRLKLQRLCHFLVDDFLAMYITEPFPSMPMLILFVHDFYAANQIIAI